MAYTTTTGVRIKLIIRAGLGMYNTVLVREAALSGLAGKCVNLVGVNYMMKVSIYCILLDF